MSLKTLVEKKKKGVWGKLPKGGVLGKGKGKLSTSLRRGESPRKGGTEKKKKKKMPKNDDEKKKKNNDKIPQAPHRKAKKALRLGKKELRAHQILPCKHRRRPQRKGNNPTHQNAQRKRKTKKEKNRPKKTQKKKKTPKHALNLYRRKTDLAAPQKKDKKGKKIACKKKIKKKKGIK